MITVHHLNNSRSQRILWLLEELGLEYEIKAYSRDPVTRLAPPALKAVHPLGKSPVVEDDGQIIAESGAIVDWLIRTHGGGRLMPAYGSPAYQRYVFWLHFAEGSAMLPLLLKLYNARLGEAGAPLLSRIESEIANHLSFLSGELGDQPFLMGEALSGADIQNSFVVEAAGARGGVERWPNLVAYAARLAARPAYQRAVERGGPYVVGR
jgi:glutathione S-transferase